MCPSLPYRRLRRAINTSEPTLAQAVRQANLEIQEYKRATDAHVEQATRIHQEQERLRRRYNTVTANIAEEARPALQQESRHAARMDGPALKKLNLGRTPSNRRHPPGIIGIMIETSEMHV